MVGKRMGVLYVLDFLSILKTLILISQSQMLSCLMEIQTFSLLVNSLKFAIQRFQSFVGLNILCSYLGARGAWLGVGRIPWVAWKLTWPRTCFKSEVKFNLPTQFSIPDPSLTPAGDWGAELHGSFVNRTLQRQFRFGCLPKPVLVKGVIPFSMPWLDSIARVRPDLPFLAFRPLRENTTNFFSVGRDIDYHACPFWSFPTGIGALPLVHSCMNPRRQPQVWRKWWHWLDDPINFRPLRTHVLLCTCHCPEVSLARIWYGPDGLVVRRVHMLRWRHIEIDRGVCHGFCCDTRWIGPLFCV